LTETASAIKLNFEPSYSRAVPSDQIDFQGVKFFCYLLFKSLYHPSFLTYSYMVEENSSFSVHECKFISM